jgi:hypothetical protein
VRRNIRIITFLFISINILTFAQVPKWATTNSHKKYPSSKYLLGVGISNGKTEAIELARADVAKQIQVKIESELETIEQEISTGDRTKLSSEIISKTKSAVSETITGIEIKETKFIKGKYYILAILNKQNYLAGLEQKMDNIVAGNGNIFNALDSYISAQNIIPEFYVKRGLYTALTGRNYGGANTVSAAGILSEIRSVLSGIDIKIISGNSQSAPIGTSLKEPVIAKVFFVDNSGSEIGIKWYPVIIKYTNGETISRTGSGEDGKINVNIIATPTGASSQRGSVIFTLGLSNLPEIFRDDLSKIQTFIVYDVLTVDLAFSVHVENASGEPHQNLTERVSAWINENGFQTDHTANMIIAGKTSITNEKVISSPAGKQYFVEVEIQLNLINTDSNKQLASVSVKGKGLAIGSKESAFEKACNNINVSKSKFAAFLQAAIQP